MTENKCFPKISTNLAIGDGKSSAFDYFLALKKLLTKILPEKFFDLYSKGSSDLEELMEYLQSIIPLVHISLLEDFPGNMSFIVFFKHRTNAFKFCHEMISHWLVPGKRMNVLVMYALDFSMPEIGNDLYTLGEITLRIESRKEYEEILRNLPIIESEICLGIVSSYYAKRILEIKGLSSDEKTAMIQEYIAHMISKRSKDFSFDVFTEMQHVLVMCRDEFKAARGVRHLSRIICIQYLFRKLIRESLLQLPEKRHLFLKLFKAGVQLDGKEKKVLGVIVAVNFLKDKEIFEEDQLIKAICNHLPEACAVPNSFFFSRRGGEPICTLYLEVGKKNGSEFSGEEIEMLRRDLPAELEGRVQHLLHSVFMPRNEEEVMRNILTLSQQIRFLRDIPQIFITFDEQTHHHLFFTVILVRVIRSGTLSVQELFKNSNSYMEYVHDRCKTIGYLRKKYRKEATVFSLKVPKEPFLRRDHSIDLYKARQAAVAEISKVVGEVRDYNGGMISKQNELLSRLRTMLSDSKKYDDLLLENFFYSLNPAIMRTVLEPEDLKKLFVMLLESISDGFYNENNYTMSVRAEPNSVFVMVAAERRIEDEIKKALTHLNLTSTALATSCVNVYETHYFGYIYLSDDPLKQRKFCIALQHALESCQHQKV